MKLSKLTLIALAGIMTAACNTSKKSATSTVSSAPSSTKATTTTTTSPAIFSVARSADGIYAPGNAELTAIQAQYANVTLEKLNEGHIIYTAGACVNCHRAQNIYRYGEAQWKSIMEDMAQRARISDTQKDAVYKYVLAIKAAQPKDPK